MRVSRVAGIPLTMNLLQTTIPRHEFYTDSRPLLPQLSESWAGRYRFSQHRQGQSPVAGYTVDSSSFRVDCNL